MEIGAERQWKIKVRADGLDVAGNEFHVSCPANGRIFITAEVDEATGVVDASLREEAPKIFVL